MLFTGELLRQAARYINDGVHPRILSDGFELAKERCVKFLESFKVEQTGDLDRELLCSVARTSIRTKLIPEVRACRWRRVGANAPVTCRTPAAAGPQLADKFTEIVTDAVLCIRRPGKPIDLHMVEKMHMVHKMATDSRLVKGLVLDHGSRHPDMPKVVRNAYILSMNVSLEYERRCEGWDGTASVPCTPTFHRRSPRAIDAVR